MPFMGNKWDDSQMIPYRTALRAVQARHPGLEPALPRPNDTARVTCDVQRCPALDFSETLPFIQILNVILHIPSMICFTKAIKRSQQQDKVWCSVRQVWRVPGYAGSVGFISSMTQHFCSSCNRLRLTADGNLKVTRIARHPTLVYR